MSTTHDTTLVTTKVRPIDIYAAPDCDIDLLTNVPRVTVGPEGTPHLVMLPSSFDGDIGDEVEATASLPLSDLMLVRTKFGAFLMRKSDYEANLPKRTPDELHRQNIHDSIDGVMAGLMKGFNPTDTAELLWDVGNELVMHPDRHGRKQALGYAMCLDALLMDPEGVQTALRELREQLRLSTPGTDILK